MRTKEVRQLIKELEDKGWVFVRMCSNNHIKYRHPNGGVTIIPSTPTDHRWLKNKRAEVRRIEEGRKHAHRDGCPKIKEALCSEWGRVMP